MIFDMDQALGSQKVLKIHYLISVFLSTDLATEIKPDVGKEKTAKYQSPEYFGYNDMSFYDIEKSCEKQRVPQPKSGLTEYW